MSNYNSPFELKNDRGNLFVNKKKKNENSPDWSGKIKMNEQEFWLSAWEKKTKSGEVYFSVSLGGMVPAQPMGQPLSQHSIDKGNGYAPLDKEKDLDEDIPF